MTRPGDSSLEAEGSRMLNRIRVGVVGASPGPGWAAKAHLPAISAIPELELAAVATTREETARQSAEAFGAPSWFTSAAELIGSAQVDLVVVTVRVPSHVDVVTEALRAGKHVLCEWPLAPDSAQAERLSAAARQAVVSHAVGLQARANPEIRYARDLIADGYLGRMTSINVSSSFHGFERVRPRRLLYMLEPANGADNARIALGHTLDAMRFLAGGFGEFSASISNQYPTFVLQETGSQLASTMPTHIALSGQMSNGAAFSLNIQGGKANSPRTIVEISGTEGDLVLTSEAGVDNPRVQITDLRLYGAQGHGATLARLHTPGSYRLGLDEGIHQPVRNVAALYRMLVQDISAGSRLSPDFDVAVELHRLIESVQQAAATGQRQVVTPRQAELDVPPGAASAR